MKTDAITKAYAALTNQERAALAFIHLCRCDELELTRVAASVPRITYTGPAIDYSECFDRLFAAASWWALEHWKAVARCTAARGGWHIMEGKNKATMEAFLFAVESWESRLMALEIALDEVGAEHGLDPEAVHKLAGCERFEPIFIESPEPEHVEAAKAELCRLMTGKNPANTGQE
jgi:hypothetical protein